MAGEGKGEEGGRRRRPWGKGTGGGRQGRGEKNKKRIEDGREAGVAWWGRRKHSRAHLNMQYSLATAIRPACQLQQDQPNPDGARKGEYFIMQTERTTTTGGWRGECASRAPRPFSCGKTTKPFVHLSPPPFRNAITQVSGGTTRRSEIKQRQGGRPRSCWEATCYVDILRAGDPHPLPSLIQKVDRYWAKLLLGDWRALDEGMSREGRLCEQRTDTRCPSLSLCQPGWGRRRRKSRLPTCY